MIRQKYDKITDLVLELYNLQKLEDKAQCVKDFRLKAMPGVGVFLVLDEMISHNRLPDNENANFRPTKAKLLEEFVPLIKKLNNNTEGQKFAFQSYIEEGYYYTEIALLKEFKFLKEGSVDPETKSMLTYDLIFPFNIKKHDDRSCVQVRNLTAFYKKKGKP